MRFILITAFAITSLLNTLFAQTCNYLAYEPFAYSSNSGLHGLELNQGWLGPWLVQDGDLNPTGYRIASNSLVSPMLQTKSNKCILGSEGKIAGRLLDTSAQGEFAQFIEIKKQAIGKHGSSLWFSCILKKTANNSDPVFIELNGSDNPLVINEQQPHIGIGYFGEKSNANNERRWSLRINDVVHLTNAIISINTDVLLVVNIEFFENTANRIYVYFNPRPGDNPPFTPILTKLLLEPLYLKSVSMYGETANSGQIDEIRFAKSYRCVAPNATVRVNQQPKADFTLSQTDGKTPLFVTLNASPSIDSDGTIIKYEWFFGDASTPFVQSTAQAFSHTFNPLGIHLIKLRVTDNDSTSHMITKSVTVRNEQLNFSCQSGLNVLNPATCANPTADVQIYRHNKSLAHTFRLLDVSQQSIPIGNNQTFENLALGNYTFMAEGLNNCRDTQHIQIGIDSSYCNNWKPSKCQMEYGVNLNYCGFNTERPFTNLFTLHGGFYTAWIDTPWVHSKKIHEMPLTTDGYPVEIPWTDNAGKEHFVKTLISNNGYLPNDTIVVLYDGVGTLTCTAPIYNSKIGYFEIIAATNGPILFEIYRSVKNNPIRNIRILRKKDEFADLSVQKFHNAFVEKIKPFSTIRFTNWMNINATEISNWKQRTSISANSQNVLNNSAGISYEYIIDLCNRYKKDAWIHIPHLATPDFIIQLAKLFDQLDPQLQVYVEYSDACWNTNLPQHTWIKSKTPDNITAARKYAELATQSMQLFLQSSSNKQRIKRVLGSNANDITRSEDIFSHASQFHYDVFAVPAHLDFTQVECEMTLDSTSTPLEIIECNRASFLQNFKLLKQQHANAKLLGKEAVHYSTGTHLADTKKYQHLITIFQQAQSHPAMYDVYLEMIDSLRSLKTSLSAFHVLTGNLQLDSDFLGLLEHIDLSAPYKNTAPKFQAILDTYDPGCLRVTSSQNPTIDPFDVQIIPNPNQGIFQVQSEQHIERYALFNQFGQLLRSGQFTNPNIEIANPGSYYLQLKSKHRSVTKKIIVL